MWLHILFCHTVCSSRVTGAFHEILWQKEKSWQVRRKLPCSSELFIKSLLLFSSFQLSWCLFSFKQQLGKEVAKYDCETTVTICDTQCWPLSENKCLTCPSNQTQLQVKSKLTRILSVFPSLCLLHVLPYIILELTRIVSQGCDDMVCFQWRLSFQQKMTLVGRAFMKTVSWSHQGLQIVCWWQNLPGIVLRGGGYVIHSHPPGAFSVLGCHSPSSRASVNYLLSVAIQALSRCL